MKKIFTIIVEYPDNDVIPSDEVIEVAQECIEQHMERYFGANIMDGDYDRIKVKEVTDGFSLVKRMREAQMDKEIVEMRVRYKHEDGLEITKEDHELYASVTTKAVFLEDEVDEYLDKMEV